MLPATDPRSEEAAMVISESADVSPVALDEHGVDLARIKQAVAEYEAALRRTIERLTWRDVDH